MGTLQSIAGLGDVSYLAAATWETIGLLALCTAANLRITLPFAERALFAAVNRRRAADGFDPVSQRAWSRERRHDLVVTASAAVLGACAGSVHLVAPATFDWYLRVGLAPVPDYGSPIPWLVNLLVLLGLGGALGLAVSCCRRAGGGIGLAGLALLPIYLAAAATGFLLGAVAGPFLLLALLPRGRLIDYAAGLVLLPLRTLEPWIGRVTVLLPSGGR